MPSRRAGILAGLYLLTLLRVAHAETSLTFDAAIALARQNNKDLKAARVRIDVARAGIEQARVALFPTGGVQARYTRNSVEAKLDLTQGTTVFQPFNQIDLSASLNVPIVVPWAYPAQAAANQTVESEKSNYLTAETALLYQVAVSFYAAAGADELVQARQSAVRLTAKTVDDAKARVETGVANKIEVARAEIAVVQAQEALRETEDLRVDVYQSLATLLQLPQPFRVAVGALPGPDPTTAATATTDLAREAMNQRPEAAAYRHSIEVSDLQSRSARLRMLPELSGFGVFRTFNYAGFYSQQNYVWALGLLLDWQLYDGGARDASRHTARLQVLESELKLAALSDSVTNEIAHARRALATKRQALTAAARVVQLAEETLEVVRAQYETGTIPQLDLLTAQETVVKAVTSVATARFELALAGVALARAAGSFPGK
jgi:outer membrane protein TolC